MMKEAYLVYIIDDDEDDRFLIWQAFQKAYPECLIFTFSNGQELVHYLTDSLGDLPHLLIMDLNMPVLNGFETLKLLKKSPDLRKIPVVMLSTSCTDSDRARCHELGVASFLVKPNSFREMQQMTSKLHKRWIHAGEETIGRFLPS
ncbi:response regulator [Tellurirhabdus bombi]|uniref:response regulator n=1 Tax=Tellurirhabdus bombi TaxID=2907205 RepID=UPI001F3268AC|nr:response regulator [Tellurirhabdus bombi]